MTQTLTIKSNIMTNFLSKFSNAAVATVDSVVADLQIKIQQLNQLSAQHEATAASIEVQISDLKDQAKSNIANSEKASRIAAKISDLIS
jgi:hypothetical protein